MLIRSLSFLTFLVMATCYSFGQFQDKVPQVKPIPPDAASLFKVLERPVGTFTGTVPVNFPLYSLKSGTLSADVSLNYNSTGGIRVEEAAGSVGLGFSLADGGGRITQVVNGKPDDFSDGFLNSSFDPSDFSCANMDHLNDVYMNFLDLEPDIFMYSFNGRSGRFFFKEDGTIVQIENAGIKVEYNFLTAPQEGIRQWIITDENGDKYYFGANKAKTIDYRVRNQYEYTSLTGGATSGGISSTSWFLTEAYDMNETSVLKYSYQLSSASFRSYSGGFMVLYFNNTDCSGFNTQSQEATVATGQGEYLVSRVDGRSGYMIFNSTADRTDEGAGRKVNSIDIYDSTGVLKKKFKFNYGYFNAGDGDALKRRLKLSNFAQFGASGTDSLVFKFDYDEITNLPSRISPSVDYWGFYNGAFNNTYFPNLIFSDGVTTVRRTRFADRTANAGSARANILTKITYPTGGYREFVYEGNTALVSTTSHQYPESAYMTSQGFTRPGTDFSAVLDPSPCLKHNFSVNSTDGGTVFNYELDVMGCGVNPYRVKLYKVTTAGDQFGGTEVFAFNNIASLYWDLVNGHYRLEVYRGSGCVFSEITGSWKESTLSTSTITTPLGTYRRNNRSVGGVRVKEIKDYDPVTNKFNSTQYFYKLYSTDSAFTSGLLVSSVRVVSMENSGVSVGCDYYKLSSTSSYPLTSHGGSYVVYPEVRTIENGNGRIDRTFSFSPDDPPSGFPMDPPTDNSHARGKLIVERVYNQSGTLLKKTTNTFTYATSQGQLGIRAKAYFRASAFFPYREYAEYPNEQPVLGACNSFYIQSRANMPAITIDSLFTPSGTMVTRTDRSYYTYNNNLFLKQVKSYVNNGAIRESNYRYPFNANGDFTLTLTAPEQTMKTTLLNKNYLFPIEEIDSLKPAAGAGSFLAGTKFTYGTYNTDNIHIAKVRTHNNITNYTEFNLTGYDTRGNLTEKYKTNDVKEVYLWGYRGEHPVAKVTGSDYATVAALVNLSVLDNPSSDAALRTELNNIRTGLAATTAQVTTYTYDRLYGISSITDPAGKTVFYSYDVFGRLAYIRDKDNNIIKKICYNYQGLPVSCN